jgi:DNA polymerase
MDKIKRLKEIAKQISRCQKCPLYQTATKPVPGDGNPDAEIMFIGEAPGYWEDQRGIPFCGAAGHLLDRLLTQINLARKDVFICNILKHRPPNNRDPLPEEIKACTPFLKEQILSIEPRIIITLGRFAMNYFIPGVYISRVHGEPRKITWEGLNLIIIPMFHPAAALRNGQVMSQIREDFLKIPRIIKQIKEEKSSPEPESEPEPKQESLF